MMILNSQPSTPNHHTGFTLIEMMVVIGIIGILIAVLLTSFGGAIESARATKCVANLRSLAQAVNNYKMASKLYPLAGSAEVERIGTYREAPGWLSWLSRTKYQVPPGEERSARSHQTVAYCPFHGSGLTFDDKRWVFEHGQIWSACGRNEQIFVCPTHQKKCQEWNLGDPIFSYVMNAKFKYDSTCRADVEEHGMKPEGFGVKDGEIRHPDRTLMFADIHMPADMRGSKLGTAESDPRVDQVLNYKATVAGHEYSAKNWDGQPEQVGFTHKGSDGRYRTHVAFADGHVEKFVEPGEKSGLNAEQLTALLCEGIDFAATGSDYTTISKAEDMQGK